MSLGEKSQHLKLYYLHRLFVNGLRPLRADHPQYLHPHQVQNVINKLCQNSYPYIDDKILQIKNGKYNFYECVWKELKKYEKSGVLNSENTI